MTQHSASYVISTALGDAELRLNDSGALAELKLLREDRSKTPEGGSFPPPPDSPAARVAAQLAEYFAGSRREFDLPLAPAGTGFQLAVWRELRKIPYGETTTYGELARRLGNPDSLRAVGAANGANPIWIIIPCHRVIGADGSLTGYAGGLEVKRRLLELEGALPRTLFD